MTIHVIKNEQHRLLPSQENELAAAGGELQVINVPAEGWDEATIREVAANMIASASAVAFVSPVPLLLGLLAAAAGRGELRVAIFHNDRREAVEVNGKLIHRLHPDGWRLMWL